MKKLIQHGTANMAINTLRSIHFLSHIALIVRVIKSNNAQAISLKTIELYTLIYVTRYLDVLSTLYSVYNSAMKIFYTSFSVLSIHLLRCYGPVLSTYEKDLDTFSHWTRCVLPCVLLATVQLLNNLHMHADPVDPIEWMFYFSISLEAVAMLPQLIVLRKYQEIECLTGCYIGFKSIYRGMYILYWMYRANTQRFYQHNYEVCFGGVLQTMVGVYILKLLFQRGWKPQQLFQCSTYTQPRVRRLADTEDACESDPRNEEVLVLGSIVAVVGENDTNNESIKMPAADLPRSKSESSRQDAKLTREESAEAC
jgi:ER lumen protein retaining receptor